MLLFGLTAEGEDPFDQVRCTSACVEHLIQVAAYRVCLCKRESGYFRVAYYGRQNVVEVMGDPTGQGADGLHLLRLAKVSFKLHLAGDIPVDAYIVDDSPGLVPDGRCRGLRFVQRAVFFYVSETSRPYMAFAERFPDIPVEGPVMFIASKEPQM